MSFHKIRGPVFSPMGVDKLLARSVPYDMNDFLCYSADGEYMIFKQDYDPLDTKHSVLEEGTYEDEDHLQSIMTLFNLRYG